MKGKVVGPYHALGWRIRIKADLWFAWQWVKRRGKPAPPRNDWPGR